MNFAESLSYLLSLGHETLAIKLGLRNTELLLERLGNPHQSYESVQIAGTNGKGSTAATLYSICGAAQISTGLYTSPHLVSITERIEINGQQLPRASLRGRRPGCAKPRKICWPRERSKRSRHFLNMLLPSPSAPFARLRLSSRS